jgi:hypothetical protein
MDRAGTLTCKALRTLVRHDSLQIKDEEVMLIEPQDVAKLLGVSGFLLSLAVIVSILVAASLPPL